MVARYITHNPFCIHRWGLVFISLIHDQSTGTVYAGEEVGVTNVPRNDLSVPVNNLFW